MGSDPDKEFADFRDFIKSEWGLKSDAEAAIFAKEILRRKAANLPGPPAFAPQARPQRAMTIEHEYPVTIDAPVVTDKRESDHPAYVRRLALAGQGKKTVANYITEEKLKTQRDRAAVADWEREGRLEPLSVEQFRTGVASAGQNMARAAAPYWARLEKSYLTPSPDPWDGPKPVKKK